MGWLVNDGRVLATLEVASSRSARRRGLIGRTAFDGALLLPHVRAVHTFGMRFAIDVAFVQAEDPSADTVCAYRVLAVKGMAPWRGGLPIWKADAVVEATAGAFERWCVGVGDQLEVR